MNGVTVLSEYTVSNGSLAGGIVIIVVGFFLLLLTICTAVKTKNPRILGLLIFAFLAFWIGIDSIASEDHITRYKVTISDDVFLKEFIEKYNIESIDGEIYIISDRDGEN